MKIRTLGLIVIPPIFLFLGVSTSLVAVAAGVYELRWGLEEESSSLAITVAEFVPPGVFTSNSEAAEEEMRYLRRSLDRLLAFGQAVRITVYDSGGTLVADLQGSGGEETGPGEPVLGAEDSALLPPPPWISPAKREVLLTEGRLVLRINSRAIGRQYVTAYAPILDRDLLVGAVAAQVSGTRMTARAAELRTGLVGVGLVILGVGVLTTLILSEYIRRRLRGLARAAEAVSRGQSDTWVDIGGIREVAELSSTFNTMAGILRDYVERGRQALISAEGHSEADSTVSAYRLRRLSSEMCRIEGRSVLATTLGKEAASSLFGVAQAGGHGFAFLGKVAGPSTLSTAVRAGTAAHWLVGALEMGEPAQDVAGRASSLFGLSELSLLSWHGDSPESPVLHTLGTSDSTSADEPSVQFLRAGGRVAVLHSLDPGGVRALNSYLALFADGGNPSVSDRLRNALGSFSNGALIIVERS